MRYKPIIRTCEQCGTKNENVRTEILLHFNTPIIKNAYLNNWTHLCPECKNNIIKNIEKLLEIWPKDSDSTEILSEAEADKEV